jgi:hypothetical protein
MRTREEVAAWHREYDARRYLTHGDQKRTNAREWNAAHPERHANSTASWNARNPERKRALVRAAAHRRRVRLRDGESERFLDAEIFERDEWVCGLCGRKINSRRTWPDPLSVSLDHVVPVSQGGGHVRSNVQASHLKCNLKKNQKLA